MLCSRCGSESYGSRSAFCTRCGASLNRPRSYNAPPARSGWKSLPLIVRLTIYALCVPVLIGVLIWHRRLEGLATDLDYLLPYEVLGVVVLVAALFFIMLDRIAKRDPK